MTSTTQTATLSKRHWKQLATESLKNALRLHRDSVILYNARSYPSAFHLAVLGLEEFAKANMVEHYYYAAITNEGFPDATTEQDWLKHLYVHARKQYAFVAMDAHLYTPELVEFLRSGGLDRRKQQATYVGLEKVAKRVEVQGKVNLPRLIGITECKQLISWVNAEFVRIHESLVLNENYYGIATMDEVMLANDTQFIHTWPFKSKVRANKSRHIKA